MRGFVLLVLLLISGCESTNQLTLCVTTWDETHKNLINLQSMRSCVGTAQECKCAINTSTRVSTEYFCGSNRALVDYYPAISLEVTTVVVYPLTKETNTGFPSSVKGDDVLEACFHRQVDLSKCTKGKTMSWCDTM